MTALKTEFPNGEVAFYAVNWGEDRRVVEDYISDSGVTVPVLLDSSEFAAAESPGCYTVPEGGESLTSVMQLKTGNPAFDPPFPLQFVIDQAGRFAYISRNHQPDVLMPLLHGLVDNPPGR
jgi:hypothetical protein